VSYTTHNLEILEAITTLYAALLKDIYVKITPLNTQQVIARNIMFCNVMILYDDII
jgi:hypothetical protein